MNYLLIAAVAFMAFLTNAAVAQQQRVAYICVGERRDQCKPATTMHIGCPEKKTGNWPKGNVQDNAKTFCTLTTADGPRLVPFFLEEVPPQVHGGQCGYALYKVSCQIK